MWERIWNWLRGHGNGPIMLVLAAFLLVIGVVALQARRDAPIWCDGVLLPSNTDDCPRLLSPAAGPFPVGTILPYYGPESSFGAGWVLCDGRLLQEQKIDSIKALGGSIVMDADPDTPGTQVPNLNDKFIRGTTQALVPGLRGGGNDVISTRHSHQWVRTENRNGVRQWYSFDDFGTERRVDSWNDGMNNEKGDDVEPLLIPGATTLFTSHQGSADASILPSYVQLRFLCKAY